MAADSSAAGRHPLRRAFDRVERAVGSPLEQLLNRTEAGELLVQLGWLSRGVTDRVGEVRAAVVHLYALPTHRDVRRIGVQLAWLKSSVDELREQVSELQAAAAPSDRRET